MTTSTHGVVLGCNGKLVELSRVVLICGKSIRVGTNEKRAYDSVTTHLIPFLLESQNHV